MNCRKSEPSLPSTTEFTEVAQSRKLPALIKPRRRLLFLTPTGLTPSEDDHTKDQSPCFYDSTKTNSQQDLRPRWVDLNKHYSNNGSLQFYPDTTITDCRDPNKIAENNHKVKTWLNNGTESKPVDSKRTKPRQYETPL